MAYIAPNGIIKVLRGVPLDTTFDHTIYWTGANETVQKQNQYNFFTSKAKYTLQPNTYQRVNRGYLRIEVLADDLYDCNYIMFQNLNFGTKWFYAFIKSVEYVNNKVSEIQYELDVMQTWYFDYTLDQCFVEREHSSTDNLFDNIVYEGLNLGDEYVCNNVDHFDMNDMYVCVLANKKIGETTAAGQTINNIYVPVRVGAGIPPDDPASIDAVLANYVEDDVVCIYQYPAFMGDASTTEPVVEEKIITPNTTTINGYKPRNNKLFCSPYNFLLVSNNSGSSAEYKWEDWPVTQRGKFDIAGVFVSTPAVLCYPKYYRGIPFAYDDGIIMNNFPQCAWGGDTFKAWWAQNKASFVTSAMTSVISGTASSLVSGARTGAWTGNPELAFDIAGLQITQNIGSTVANSVAKVEDIKHAPNQMHGQTQTDSLNPGMERVEFTFYSMSIKRQYAEIIDDYFDRYGYATKRNKVPNRYARARWTYTKTIGCTITGSIPADAAKAICTIYNNGITFWANTATVGDYSNPETNTPLGGGT